nr:MAG TPA: hypothetical protein [Caudoviricetes sp.]
MVFSLVSTRFTARWAASRNPRRSCHPDRPS